MEPTLEGAMALARSAAGPLSPHLESFVTSLIDRQYSVISLRSKAWHATAFDTWLAEHGVCLADLSDTYIDQFHCRSYRPRSDCQATPRCYEVSALRQLLRYLRERGQCAPESTTIVPADSLVASFEQFLIRERGLAAGTIRYYCDGTRGLLYHCFGSGRVDLRSLHAADVIGFIRERSRRLRPRGNPPAG